VEIRKPFHALVLASLTLCTFSHLLDVSAGWDCHFLQTGKDSETSLLVLAVVLGLALATAVLIWRAIPSVSDGVGIVIPSVELLALTSTVLAIPPQSSPPSVLRI
jgi:hypothetical protein